MLDPHVPAAPILVWTLAAFYFEAAQISGRETSRAKRTLASQLRSYVLQDPFNVLDISALVASVYGLSLVSLKLRWFDSGSGDGAEGISRQMDVVMALSVFLMWVRQLKLLTLISRSTAPFMFMVVNMFHDLFQFLMLLLVLLVAFAAVMSMLFNEHGKFAPHGEDVLLSQQELLGDCAQAVEQFSRFEGALISFPKNMKFSIAAVSSHRTALQRNRQRYPLTRHRSLGNTLTPRLHHGEPAV